MKQARIQQARQLLTLLEQNLTRSIDHPERHAKLLEHTLKQIVIIRDYLTPNDLIDAGLKALDNLNR